MCVLKYCYVNFLKTYAHTHDPTTSSSSLKRYEFSLMLAPFHALDPGTTAPERHSAGVSCVDAAFYAALWWCAAQWDVQREYTFHSGALTVCVWCVECGSLSFYGSLWGGGRQTVFILKWGFFFRFVFCLFAEIVSTTCLSDVGTGENAIYQLATDLNRFRIKIEDSRN